MGLKRSIIRACGVGCLMALGAVAAPTSASAHGGGHGVRVLLEGLSSPKGLAVNAERNLVIGQGAFGPPGPVLEFFLRGPNRGDDPSLTRSTSSTWRSARRTAPAGPSAPASRARWLFHQLADGTIVAVRHPRVSGRRPRPGRPDGIPDRVEPVRADRDEERRRARRRRSRQRHHPGDTRWRGDHRRPLRPGGRRSHRPPPARSLTRCPRRSTPRPCRPPSRSGPDGAIYVGELKGFPFRPGSSNIWRIKPNAEGAWCSVNSKDPTRKCSLYKTGSRRSRTSPSTRTTAACTCTSSPRTVCSRSRPVSRPVSSRRPCCSRSRTSIGVGTGARARHR